MLTTTSFARLRLAPAGCRPVAVSRSSSAVAARLTPPAVLVSWEQPGYLSPRRLLAEWLEAAGVPPIPELGYARELLLTCDRLPPPRGSDPWKMPWQAACEHCQEKILIPLATTRLLCPVCKREFDIEWPAD